jgi:hypothetical protein
VACSQPVCDRNTYFPENFLSKGHKNVQKLTAKTKAILLRALYLLLAVYAYFGGRCPAEGCPACRWIGK